MRCKAKAASVIFDAMPWTDDLVIVRPVTLEQVPSDLLTLEEFADYFTTIGDTE